jgi:2-methylcitrate dehydratase PrpD
MTHLLENGLGCRNGVTAALLAAAGVTADPDVIEGPGGFADMYCTGEGGYDFDTMVTDLGDPFYIISPGSSVKKYGCCFYSHRALDGVLQLMQEHDISYESVESVQVDVSAFIPTLLRFPDPENAEQSKFSMQHALAVALCERKVDLSGFTDAAVANPHYREARKKIHVVTHADWPAGLSGARTPVTIKLRDGRTYSKTVDVIKGSVEMPLSEEELLDRYEMCARGVLSSPQIQRSIDLLLRLDELDNVLELVELATFGEERRAGGVHG